MNASSKALAVEEDGVTHYLKQRWADNAVTLCDKTVWFEPSPNNQTMQVCAFVSAEAAQHKKMGATCMLCLDLDGTRRE